VLLWLQKNGIDPNSVKFVEIPPAAMVAALDAKRVDAMATYEPFVGSAQVAGARLFAKPYEAIAPTFLTGLWFGNTAWLNAHKDAVRAFNRVITRADQYVNTHYDELAPLIAQVTKLPPETLRTMVHLYTPPTLEPAALQPVIDAAARAKEIPAAFPATDMIFPGTP
jgi:ABC-type nitrate/sulfonate/bicarbonate transport system substrate-binding protein